MTILMLAGYYPPDVRGGGEISTKILAEILTDAGCNIHVLTCGEAESNGTEGAITVHRIPSPNLYWDYKAQDSKLKQLAWHVLDNYNPRSKQRVKQFLAETRANLLLTSTIENFGADGWVAARDCGIPSVHILRSYYPFCARGNAVRNGKNCVGQCTDCRILSDGRRRASSGVDGVIGISRYILDRHRQHGFFRSALSEVIGEPIEHMLFADVPRAVVPRRFGYLGVLSADKGLASLAEAWKRLAPLGCSLRIGGTGKKSYVLQAKAAFPPDVKFDGWVNSSYFLSQIDFLVVPSIWNEPFGRIVIEAFASGVPVIGSRIAGIAETIRNGFNGFTYNPGDTEDLERVLLKSQALDAEAYSKLSQGARLSVEAYDSRLIAAAHCAFYEKVIALRRA